MRVAVARSASEDFWYGFAEEFNVIAEGSIPPAARCSATMTMPTATAVARSGGRLPLSSGEPSPAPRGASNDVPIRPAGTVSSGDFRFCRSPVTWPAVHASKR